jgi:hypothetical protein
MQMKDTNETLSKHVLKEIVVSEDDGPQAKGFQSGGIFDS